MPQIRETSASPGKSTFIFDSDVVFKWLTIVAALVVPVVMTAIFWELLSLSWPALKKFGWRFFVNQTWNPVTQVFGAASSIYGTIVSTLIAMVLAVPMSIVIALFLVELAPPRLSKVVGTLIELLAAIPSIIYGMWGLFIFAPFMAKYVAAVSGALSGIPAPFPGTAHGHRHAHRRHYSGFYGFAFYYRHMSGRLRPGSRRY